MLGLILGILGFLFSMQGLLCFFGGLVLFLAMPMASAITDIKAPSKLYLWLGSFPIRRLAVVVSEHDDALVKQMKYLGLGAERVKIDGENKLISDPANRLHYWNGLTFGLADEEHGVFFDPRDAAVGMRKRFFDDRDEGEYLATEDEWQAFGYAKWKPGVFGMPRAHELVDLSAAKELIDGGERAEFAERVEELYKNSRTPLSAGTPASKFIYPIIGFAVAFFGIWVGVVQFGNAIPNDSVSFGAGLALLLSGAGINWRRGLGAVIAILLLAGSVGGLVVLFGPGLALAITVAILLGWLLLPILTFFAIASARLGGVLSTLYFRMGFAGWRKPVFVWTPEKYVVREYDSLETTENIHWYGLFGTTVGFTYEPAPESWGAEPISHHELEAQQPIADGGHELGSIDTRLPKKYTRSTQLARDDYGAFIPARLDDDEYYIRTGIAMNRFANSATGEKAMKKLLEAKDEHGEGSGELSDGFVMKATIGSTLFGAILGVGVFILPVLL